MSAEKERGTRSLTLVTLVLLLLAALLSVGGGGGPAYADGAGLAGWSPIIQNLPSGVYGFPYLGGTKFICSDGSKTYLLDTASSAWNELCSVDFSPESNPAYSRVYVVSDHEFYFIPNARKNLYHYDSGGLTAKTLSDFGFDNSYYFYSVAGNAPDDMYVIVYKSSDSHLFHYDGSAWTAMDASAFTHSTSGYRLYSVYALGEQDIYIRWRDSASQYYYAYYNGSAWSNVPLTASQNSASMVRGFGGGKLAIVSSDDKKIYVLEDGILSEIPYPIGQAFNGNPSIDSRGNVLYFSDPYNGFYSYDGNDLEEIALPDNIDRCWGISVDEQGGLYFIGRDAQTQTMNLYKWTLGEDTTPPAFADGYPRAENPGSSGCDLLVKLDEPGAAYYKAVASGSDPGSDYANWTAVSVPGAGGVSATIGGLAGSTNYDLYVIARDTAGNWQSAPVKLSVATTTDTTAPSFASGYPQAASITASGFDLRVRLSESGTVYYRVVPDGTPVTPDQGQTVAEAVYLHPDGSLGVPGLDEASATITGLAEGTAYDLYVVAADTVGNLQAAPVELNLTTPTVPVFTQAPAADILSSTLVDIRCQAKGDSSLSACYYLLQDAGTAAPPAAAILSGGRETNFMGGSGGIYTDSFSALITGLQPGHSYDAYFILATANPGVYGVPFKLEFTTTTGIEGYTWLDLGEAPGSTVLKNIGNDKFLVRDDLYGTKRGTIVDLGANTTTDFVYQVNDAYVMADDDFFFSEIDGSNYYVRRSVGGTVYDRMPCAITNPQSFAGDAAAVYVFGGGLAQYNPSTGAWDQIGVDPDLPAATFTKGVCTPHYLYLEGNLTADNSMVLYRYARDNRAWTDITPPDLEGGFLLALGDQDLLAAGGRHMLRYRDGTWAEASAFDPYYTKGTTAGTSGLGSGLVFVCHNDYGSASLTTAQYFDGANWRELPLPGSAYLGLSACTGLDGNVYFLCATNGGDHLYELARVASGDTTPPVITTSAADTTVHSASYTFTVKAEDETDGVVRPTVKLGGPNGAALTGTAQGDGGYSYTATLAEGPNTIYIEASDESGNKATLTYTVTYTIAADTTPPVFASGYPQATNRTTAGFDLAVKLGEPGTAYYKVVTDGTAPGSEYATWTSVSIPGADTVTAAVYGLAAGTAYDLHVIARDTAGNWQDHPVELDVATQGGAPGGFSIERIGSGGFSLGGDASVTVRMTNNTGAAQQATLIVCLYDNAGGDMENYSYASKSVAAGEQVDLAGDFRIPAAGDYTVKAFVWDSFDSMKPLLDQPLVIAVD